MLKQVLILAAAAVASAQEQPQLQATVRMADPKGTSGVGGNLTFTQLTDGRVHLQGIIIGLDEGDYGFHVHEKGDITGGCMSTGAHFNPEKKLHGHPEDEERHVGDLGNIHFDAQRVANIDLYDHVISLTGPHSILGRAVVLHEKADDFGRTLHPDSKKTGNAGGRVSCGVIGILDPVTPWKTNAAVKSSITFPAFALPLFSIIIFSFPFRK